jgi:hypothetical protein
MNDDVQAELAELQEKGRTLANLARALELFSGTIESGNAGTRSPANPKSVLVSLDQLIKRKRIHPKKIYTKGSRKSKFTEEYGNGE